MKVSKRIRNLIIENKLVDLQQVCSLLGIGVVKLLREANNEASAKLCEVESAKVTVLSTNWEDKIEVLKTLDAQANKLSALIRKSRDMLTTIDKPLPMHEVKTRLFKLTNDLD